MRELTPNPALLPGNPSLIVARVCFSLSSFSFRCLQLGQNPNNLLTRLPSSYRADPYWWTQLGHSLVGQKKKEWISHCLIHLIWNSGTSRKDFLEPQTASSGTSIGDSSSDSLKVRFFGLILILKDSLGKGSVRSISKEGRTFYYAFPPFPVVARANPSSTGAPTASFLGAIPTIIPRPLSLPLQKLPFCPLFMHLGLFLKKKKAPTSVHPETTRQKEQILALDVRNRRKVLCESSSSRGKREVVASTPIRAHIN